MQIAKFRKMPADRKRYEVNYEDWLNIDETLVNVQMTGNVPEDDFYIDGFIIPIENDKEVIFYVSGGLSGVQYEVTVEVETSLQQIKQDTITFVVM